MVGTKTEVKMWVGQRADLISTAVRDATDFTLYISQLRDIAALALAREVALDHSSLGEYQ